MSVLLAALVISGFSRTVNANLFHGNPPRPLLLWIHGTAFSTWILFFIAQSALVRARKVSAEEELRHNQAVLAHASRITSLGLLVASIAHEVKQPLTAMITNAGTCLLRLSADLCEHFAPTERLLDGRNS
jgi:signal transduction histidine kinase